MGVSPPKQWSYWQSDAADGKLHVSRTQAVSACANHNGPAIKRLACHHANTSLVCRCAELLCCALLCTSYIRLSWRHGM